MVFGLPSWLPLPWADVEDFIETINGDMYVDIRYFRRIVRYDRFGHFVASYAYPTLEGAKFTNLATDHRGRIYIEQQGRIFIYTTDMKNISIVSPSKSHPLWSWKLDENGSITLGSSDERVHRVALPGDTLFTVADFVREHFQSNDGSVLVKKGGHIEKRLEGKRITKFGSSWLIIFVFPWPIIAWMSLFLFVGAIQHWKKIEELIDIKKESTKKRNV